MTLSEAHIQKACSELLELDGWRRVRMDMPQLRGLGVQEKGMADDLYIRYDFCQYVEEGPAARSVEAMWIEWKRVTSRQSTRAKAHQRDWHTLERKRGALTLIAGEDFPATIEGFRNWYKTSGLMRRIILS